MFLLRAYGPERFQGAGPDRITAPAAAPVAEALVHLHPEPPAAPAALMAPDDLALARSEEHTSELQSLMRISYAVFCLKKKNSYTPISLNIFLHSIIFSLTLLFLLPLSSSISHLQSLFLTPN